jgi:hypothetical protein
VSGTSPSPDSVALRDDEATAFTLAIVAYEADRAGARWLHVVDADQDEPLSGPTRLDPAVTVLIDPDADVDLPQVLEARGWSSPRANGRPATGHGYLTLTRPDWTSTIIVATGNAVASGAAVAFDHLWERHESLVVAGTAIATVTVQTTELITGGAPALIAAPIAAQILEAVEPVLPAPVRPGVWARWRARWIRKDADS